MLIDLPHLIITKVGGHRRPLGYFSKHNDKRGPRARANFLLAPLGRYYFLKANKIAKNKRE